MVPYMVPFPMSGDVSFHLTMTEKEEDVWRGRYVVGRKKKSSGKQSRKYINVSLHDFEAMAKQHGYIEEGSKHPKVIIGNHTLPYKRENPVKACYVKELYDIIDQI